MEKRTYLYGPDDKPITSHTRGTKEALDVVLLDAFGNPVSAFGAGTQYTEGDVAATIIGNAMMWEDTGDVLRPISAAKPLPVNVVAGSTSGTEYTEGDTDATITGGAIMWEDSGDTLRPVSLAKPLPISAASLPLPAGAATAANQQNDALTDTELRASAVPVSAASLPLPAGAATAANQQNDALTDTELRASAVPVSAASLPLPSGAATAANQQTDALTDTELRASAVPVSAASLPLPAGAATAAGQQSDALTDTELRATPVPVSGTVTASGPLTDTELRASAVPVSAASLPLPSGAATAANQLADGHHIAIKPESIRVDDVGGGTKYFGFAAPGVATSAGSWKIFRMSGTAPDFQIEYADGDANYDNIWDNRAALSYS